MESSQEPYFFISYSRHDSEIVREIADRLVEAGISVWLDIVHLQPGEFWADTIDKAIRDASGLIAILSSYSLRSMEVMNEITYAQARGGRVLPVIIESVEFEEIPARLLAVQMLDISDGNNFEAGIQKLIKAAHELQGDERLKGVGLTSGEINSFAEEAAEQARRQKRVTYDKPPESVFIVHGHDHDLRGEVENYLLQLGIKSVVLGKMSNEHTTLIQKFLTWGEETRFAVILITADDLGAGRYQFDVPEVGSQSLQFRARQNVILELGFFYGYLGLENVFVLYKRPNKVFPNFERPSDLNGVLFEEVNETEEWKQYLKERLSQAGFELH